MSNTIKNIDNEEVLDRCHAAYQAEYDRWCWRRKTDKDGFELVRNSSPENNINADEYFEVTNLTKRECADSDDARSWLRTYRGRAAMRAALEAY